ncbi:MAG: Gfo/Idh/MocA family oxidoreductase, partial [Planctomycetota bacterium]|nr:Gfo/Idh/MocA family oxidoreductase [Planctomycetota bacterium]
MSGKRREKHSPGEAKPTQRAQPADRSLNRREFVHSVAALAGATLVLSGSGCGQAQGTAPAPAGTPPLPPPARAGGGTGPFIPKAEQPPPAGGGPDLNIALIGAGRQGRECLMEAILKIPNIKFKAVCDMWEYNRNYAVRGLKKRKHEVTGYADYQEMLAKEKDIDAVVVASPDFVHAEHTCAALKAGKHVYCEKVMARTLEEAKKMVLAAREAKKLLQIGHQRYSNPRYQFAREKLLGEANLLGQITNCYAQWNRSMRPDFGMPKGVPPLDDATLKKYGYDTLDQFLNWRFYKKYGNGPIADLGAHQVGVFGWFLGVPPKVVMASGATYDKKHEWSDNVLAILEYDTPKGTAQAFYQVATTTGARGYFETFMGVDGSMQISEDPGKCKIYSEGRLVNPDGSHPWQKWADKKLL